MRIPNNKIYHLILWDSPIKIINHNSLLTTVTTSPLTSRLIIHTPATRDTLLRSRMGFAHSWWTNCYREAQKSHSLEIPAIRTKSQKPHPEFSKGQKSYEADAADHHHSHEITLQWTPDLSPSQDYTYTAFFQYSILRTKPWTVLISTVCRFTVSPAKARHLLESTQPLTPILAEGRVLLSPTSVPIRECLEQVSPYSMQKAYSSSAKWRTVNTMDSPHLLEPR